MPRTLLPPRPFIPAPNCASVNLFYSLNGVNCENVINVSKGSPFSSSDLAALRGVIDTWDNTTWKNIRGSGCALFRIRSKALDTNSSPLEDYYLPTPRAGGIGSGMLTASVTFAVKLVTARAGRSYRGRLYLVGLTGAQLGVTPNQILTGTATLAVADLNLLLTNLASAGFTLGVLSYATAKSWRTTAHFEPATGWVAIDTNLDSQRRRLTGRGI